MTATIIAHHPPQDGRDWDCQCARCGSSCRHVECESCDHGWTSPGELYDEDPLWYDEDDREPCRVCHGASGWWVCMSKPEWCEAHPLDGRQHVPAGTIEWWTHEARDAAMSVKKRSWAAGAVAKMSNDEVLYWCKRFGLRPPNAQTVSPVERMVDGAAKPVRRPLPRRKR